MFACEGFGLNDDSSRRWRLPWQNIKCSCHATVFYVYVCGDVCSLCMCELQEDHVYVLRARCAADCTLAARNQSGKAAYMKGIVGEFIRYGNRVSKSSSTAAGATAAPPTATITMGATEVNGEYTEITNNGSRARINREYDIYGKLWETYTFPKAGEEDGKMLPLSLNTPDSEVSKTKIQKSTGEVKQRTKREIAYLQRQAVPDYSVVRIHF